MSRIYSTFLLLVWGLWFGGLVVLFMAVSSLFATFADRHDIAGRGAAQIFRLFSIYQLGLAAIALLAALAMQLASGSRGKIALITLLGLATAAAAMVSLWFTPRMEQLRLDGLTHSAEFAKLHGWSMGTYSIETLLLLVAGFFLPAVMRK